MSDSIKALQTSVDRNASDAKALVDKNTALEAENKNLTATNADLQTQLAAAADTTAIDTARQALDSTNTSIETALTPPTP